MTMVRVPEDTTRGVEPACPDRCSVDECSRPRSKRGMCNAHYLRWWRRGGDVAVRRYRPRAEVVGYQAIHARLWRDRGYARDYDCAQCGGSAQEWAYDHSDPDELTSVNGMPYSMDLGRYVPLCCSCHKNLDLSVGAA